MSFKEGGDTRRPRLVVEVPCVNNRKKAESEASTPSPETCLDIRLFYVRVCSEGLDQAPDSLILRCLGPSLEVNGGKNFPADEPACLTLRRDRVDAESAEATYVSTDNIRTAGSLPFEVYDRDQLLLCGIMSRLDCLDRQDFPTPDSVSALIRASWNMECRFAAIGSPACAFLKKRSEFGFPDLSPPPTMEVYVAGRFRGSPVVLTQTVQLAGRRNGLRVGAVDGLSQVHENQRPIDNLDHENLADQIEEHRIYEELRKNGTTGVGRYGSESGEFVDSEDGGLTWFNAGVRVGVGIGLGMCLGIGIGLGLLIRTYQATTKTFKRRFL